MSTKSIRYPAKNGSLSDAFLLELPPSVLEDGNLSLIGDANDSAVITTSNRTFKLREASTSNVIQIVSEDVAETEDNVIISSSTYYELEHTIPLLESCKSMIRANWYPVIPDSQVPSDLYVDNIMTSFQASPTEILAVLKREKATNMSGVYRAFDPEYVMRFFEILFANCILQNVSILDERIDALFDLVNEQEEEYSNNVVRAILDLYSRDGMLAPEEVTKLFGSELLKAKQSWSEEELLAALDRLVGDLNPSMDMLAVPSLSSILTK
jgi:hypothetical protein